MNEKTKEMILNVSTDDLAQVGIKLGEYPKGSMVSNYVITNGVIDHTLDTLRMVMEAIDEGTVQIVNLSELTPAKVVYPIIKQQVGNENFIVAFTGLCAGMYVGGANGSWKFGESSLCWVHHDNERWVDYHRTS